MSGAKRSVRPKRAPRPVTLEVPPGSRRSFELPVARHFSGEMLSLPVTVVHGTTPRPRVWLDAAIHGDELNGMEIIRRVLGRIDPTTLVGTLVAVPVVNVFGFVRQDRYLPDRRDLNRCFPGSAKGSLAARLASLFLESVVDGSDAGLDFHTGSNHRKNLPQIRAELDDPEVRALAEAFAAPMMYRAPQIKGSLRAAAGRRGVPILVYEAGEPLRFDEEGIRTGVDGCLRVLAALGMGVEAPPPGASSFEAKARRWIRASRSGVFHSEVELGVAVARGARLGWVRDPFTGDEVRVRAPFRGLVIGFTNNPLVHRGDALVHLARVSG